MAYQFEQICRMVQEAPEQYIRSCDRVYADHVAGAADRIVKTMDTAPIVLLSGPSGSGKTTTAKKIQEQLEKRGVHSHTISLDDYFRNFNAETHPRNERGEVDYESPLCLDLELLHDHFLRLSRGEEIQVPRFDFANQRRMPGAGRPLRLGKREIAIYEGIHALNDLLTDRVESHAVKVYISARSNIMEQDRLLFKGTWIRFVRRVVRDAKFRGAAPEFSMELWGNIRRGEKLYISPFKDKSDILFDSTLPYEVCLLRDYALPLFQHIPDCPRKAELEQLRTALSEFPSLSDRWIPKDSLLREFIGGGIYEIY